MTRYIDAAALYASIAKDTYMLRDRINSRDYGMYLIGIKQKIEEAPTADVAEVVRCKDCKHRTELPYVDKNTHEPIYDCGYNISAIWGEENGYCSHGERRE